MGKNPDPIVEGDVAAGATEVTPLLGAGETANPRQNGILTKAPDGEQSVANGTVTPGGDADHAQMKTAQILLLCFASLAEPIACFSIFPFISEMIMRTGEVSEDDFGFWAGAIESLFSMVQMVLMLVYGRFADRFGRKPVLVFSLGGITVASSIFGFAKTLPQMIAFRMIAGIFSGSAVTIRTMVSENSNKYTQGRAFSWYMFARNIGILLGPLCGGPLADPATNFPNTIGKLQLFKDYPYALASLTAGAICSIAFFANLFLLEETRNFDEDMSAKGKAPMSTWQVFKSPGVPMVLYINAHVALLGLAHTAVMNVFQATKIAKGGLSFNPAQISITLAIAAASQAAWMLLAFPVIQRRFGTGNLLRACAVAWPLFHLFFPLMNELLRAGIDVTAFWIIAVPGLVFFSGVAMSYACVQLCLNDVSPSPAVLATLNGLTLTIGSAIRAFTPALITTILSTGTKLGWLHGHLVWVVLVSLGVLLNVAVYFLPPAAEGKLPPEGQIANDDGEEGRAS